jgi:RNA polymerase sigma factor (TIGR02999 family)
MPPPATEPAPAAVRQHAAADLLPVVYDNLRRLAARLLGHAGGSQTLAPTALVHEAFVRLTASKEAPSWENTEHFFAAAARAMRCILVDHHRRKGAFRRIVAGGAVGVPEQCADPPVIDFVALDDALNQLAAEDLTAARVVEYRFFAGLSLEQTAAALSISKRAVSDKWAFARAWLLHLLEPEDAKNPRPAG